MRVVRGLVHKLIADAVDVQVTTAIRDTVDAVAELTEADEKHPHGKYGKFATIVQLAEAWSLTSAVYRRARKAIARGTWSTTRTTASPGSQWRLKVGDPMPVDKEVLPTVDEVETAWEAATAAR